MKYLAKKLDCLLEEANTGDIVQLFTHQGNDRLPETESAKNKGDYVGYVLRVYKDKQVVTLSQNSSPDPTDPHAIFETYSGLLTEVGTSPNKRRILRYLILQKASDRPNPYIIFAIPAAQISDHSKI